MLRTAVELEPEPPADLLGDALDAERRGRGHGEGHAEGLGGARQDQLRAVAAGADAAGGGDGERQVRRLFRRSRLLVSTCATFTSTRAAAAPARRRRGSRAASPRPRRRRRRNRRSRAAAGVSPDRRRSSMLTAFPKGIIAGHSTFESQIRVTPVRSCRCRSIRPACWPRKTFRPSRCASSCPFPPAGAVDIAIARHRQRAAARSSASRWRSTTGPAPAATSACAEAARSAPDGYTILMSTSGIQAINPVLYAKMPFDPNKDLIPVAPLVVAQQRAGGASVGAGEEREGSDRPGQEGAGQVDLRLERQRHQHPHVGRDVHADDQDRHPAHPVQGQRPGGHRPARRPGAT